MPPTTTVALATPPPPGLAEATKNSTTAWQHHLAELFRTAKDRFPDVVWELTPEDDADKVADEVWGHKAIVYARAPPSFQSRYFSFRPNHIPYSQSPTGYPSNSAFSLSLPPAGSRSPSPTHQSQPRPSSPSTLAPSLLRISSSINPALFSNELEYLYTGQGFGEAFEFLFDSANSHAGEDDQEEVNPEELRIDKLRKDLVYMWRSRLYSDVRIALSGNFSSSSLENTTAIFSSHRFILVSRSPYFHDALLSWPQQKSNSGETPLLTLPSPPFTPPSLHFTLGFMYTGTLVFSHRTYDLSTAFAILKAALYLSLPSLQDEIQARIAHEMLHGLFHAFLPFQEYERLTQGKWGTGGCRCRQCARRVPRVLEFSLEDDVKNTHLERGSRRALVGLYGEGWCSQEFAMLSPKLRESLLKGVAKRTTPPNVFPLLFAAEHALVKLSSNIEGWADTVKEMIVNGRKVIDEVICKESEACFGSEEWNEIVESDGARFGDKERVEWVMSAVMRGVRESCAGMLYQTLVSGILIKAHPTEPNAPFLLPTSQIRQQVEQTRMELLKWISKRWVQIRQERGFDALEGWAIKELGDYMEVPIDDLLSPAPPTRNNNNSPRPKHAAQNNNHNRPISSHPHTSRIDADSETASSMRVSVLSRNLAQSSRRTPTVGGRGGDNASMHSVSSVRTARSTLSTTTTASDSTVGRSSVRGGAGTRGSAEGGGEGGGGGMSPARRIVQATRARDAALAISAQRASSNVGKGGERPDSKLTPVTPRSVRSAEGNSPTPQPSLKLPGDDDELAETGEGGEEGEEEDKPAPDEEEGGDTVSTISMNTTSGNKKTVITRASISSVHSSRSTTGGSRKGTGAAGRKASSSGVSLRSQTPSARSPNTGAPAAARSQTPVAGGAKPRKGLVPARGGGSRPVSRTSTRASTASIVSTSTTSTTTTTTSASLSTLSRVSSGGSTSTLSRTGSRPVSGVSTASSASGGGNRQSVGTEGTFRTASSGGGSNSLSPPQGGSGVRSRKSSATSTASGRTAGRGVSPSPSAAAAGRAAGRGAPSPSPSATASPPVARTRTLSSGSNASGMSSAYATAKSHVTSTTSREKEKKERVPPVPSIDLTKLSATPAGGKKRVGGAPGSVRNVKSVSSIGKEKEKKTVRKGREMSAPSSPQDVRELGAGDDKEKEEKEEKERADEEGGGDEVEEMKNTPSTITIKQSPLPPPTTLPPVESLDANTEHKKTDSTNSTGSNATIKKKRSNETVMGVDPATASSRTSSTSSDKDNSKAKSMMLDKPQPPLPNPHPITPSPTEELQKQPPFTGAPRGATLDIGIPCIVSSKRKRFKAYARYIGEVEGEYGPWVGVEVPIPLGESWADRDVDSGWQGVQWNDGSWAGIRYFEVGGGGSGPDGGHYAWDDYRAARRRRVDGASSVSTWLGGTMPTTTKGLKREGDQLAMGMERMKRMRSASPAVSDGSGAESRGLFVRPQQVLYVVDAVEHL